MKSPNECLEEIQDGKHGIYPYTITLTDFINPDALEGMLKELVRACESGYSCDVRLAGNSIGYELIQSMYKRAEAMSEKSIKPLDESNLADIEREK